MLTDEATIALGARVRSLRRERGWTLKQLGREAGLSHPFLSQLERGLARPSVGSVERIARALGVPVGRLWSTPARGGRTALVRSGCGEHARHDDAAAPGGVRTLVGEPVAVREWTGGSRRWPEEREVATGDVLLYVARGGLEVDLDGEIHALEEGDALLFDGGVPHRVRRTGGVAHAGAEGRDARASASRSRCTPPCGSSASARRLDLEARRPPARGTGRRAGGPGSASHSSDAGPEQPRQQRQQQLRVAALVEQVGARARGPTARARAAAPAPPSRAALDLERDPVARRVVAQQLDRLRRPVGREHAPARERGGEARQPEPAAQLQRARAVQRAHRDAPRQRDAARPQLRPVGQELLVLEGVLVDQRLGVARAQDAEVAAGEHDRLLDQVELWQRVGQAAKAGRLPRISPGDPRVTSVDVARAAGVSQSTVSLVLSGKSRGRISAKTEEAVRRAAEELGYRPNMAARALRTGAARSVGLVVPDVTHPFFGLTMRGAQEAAWSAGYAVALVDVPLDRPLEAPLEALRAGPGRRLHLLLRRAAGAAAGRRADRRDRGRAGGRAVGARWTPRAAPTRRSRT